MLVAGGLLDQPAEMWFKIQAVGWLDSLIERTEKEDFKWDQLSASELEYYMDVILPLQTELLP